MFSRYYALYHIVTLFDSVLEAICGIYMKCNVILERRSGETRTVAV